MSVSISDIALEKLTTGKEIVERLLTTLPHGDWEVKLHESIDAEDRAIEVKIRWISSGVDPEQVHIKARRVVKENDRLYPDRAWKNHIRPGGLYDQLQASAQTNDLARTQKRLDAILKMVAAG